MTKEFLAKITVLNMPPDVPVDPEYGVPAPPRPEHPIVLPPESPGKPPEVIWPSPGHPANPIVIPEPPLEIWGGAPQPHPEHPIVIPPPTSPNVPSHPIEIPVPPDVVWPPDAHIEHPIVLPLPPGIWGPNDPRPTPPIVIPPTDPERRKLFTWYSGWSDSHGWVVVAVPNFPTVTPSAAKKK